MNYQIDYINRGTYFTSKQLDKIIKMLGSDYRPQRIIVFENRSDIIKYIHFLDIFDFLSPSIWSGKIEGLYDLNSDQVYVFIFAQNYKEYDKTDKALFSIHALMHELRHRWQFVNSKFDDEEADADKFATFFLNDKSEKISKIMSWTSEWEVEEE